MKSRRLICVLLALAIAGAVLPAGASTFSRTARAKYRGPGEIEAGSAVVQFGPVTVYNEQILGAVRFETRSDERLLRLKLVDESGGAVKGHVEQRINGHYKLLGHFCGSTDRPFRIKPGKPVLVYPGSDPCGGSVTGATQGVVVARFSR